MLIRPVDVFDDDDFARAHAVYAAADRHGRPSPTTWPLAEMKASYRTPSSAEDVRLYVAEDDGDALGVARLELPLTDNLHLAGLAVYVRPDRWRRGVGTALAAHLRTGAEAAGRRLAGAWIAGRQVHPDGTPVDGPEPPGDAFARACGLTLRNTDLHRVLPLPVDEAVLDRLAADAAPHHADYRMVSFTARCPDEYVPAYCRLKSAMIAEAPMGDVEMDPEVWDERRLREEETELAAMGRTRFTVLALAPDGEVAGFNELLHAAHDPARAVELGHPGPPRASRPPAGHGGQDRQPEDRGAGPPRGPRGAHPQRRAERADGRRQRPAGVRADRAGR